MIKYTNLQDQTVSDQQLKMMDEYKIHTYDDSNGKLKKIETIVLKRGNIPFTWFRYYLDPSENKNDIIQQYTSEEKDSRLAIFYNKQNIYGIDIWDCENYNNKGVLVAKAKIGFDSLSREILKVDFDLLTSEIKKNSIPRKHYFGTTADEMNNLSNLELMFTYEYNEELNLFVTFIKDVNETTGEINTMNVDKFIEIFGQDFWDAHPYYHSVLPLLPTNPIL